MNEKKMKLEVLEDLGVSESDLLQTEAARMLKKRRVMRLFIEDLRWTVGRLKSIEDEGYKGVAPEDYMIWKRAIVNIESSCQLIEKMNQCAEQDAWASMQLLDEVCLEFKKAVQEGLKGGVYTEKDWECVKEKSRSLVDVTLCILQVESERVVNDEN